MSSSHTLLASSHTVASIKVKIHTLCLFQILDHFSRRNKDQGPRVIGALLGNYIPASQAANSVENEDNNSNNNSNSNNNTTYKFGGTLEITNCFPILHKELESKIEITIEYYEKMVQLHAKVNPKEKIIGWYSTGETLNESSFLIHDFFGKKVQNPIHLLVDPSLKSGSLGIKGFISNQIIIDSKVIGSQFHELNVEIRANEAERIGVSTLIKSVKAQQTGRTAVLSELETFESSIKKLYSLLDDACKYLEKVQKGEVEGNKEIGRMLADALSTIPNGNDLSAVLNSNDINNNLQDVLMIGYLANVMRLQLALGEKIASTTF